MLFPSRDKFQDTLRGWGIWDRAFTLPVVTGHKPYDKEFTL